MRAEKAEKETAMNACGRGKKEKKRGATEGSASPSPSLSSRSHEISLIVTNEKTTIRKV